MENSDIQKLLQENIEASNRTTYAVRAFVRFLFIQLVGITAAFLLNTIASAGVDPISCAYSGDNCEPILILQIFAVLVWLGAVFWSSIVGWRELALSDPNPNPVEPSPDATPAQNSFWNTESANYRSSCKHCGASKEDQNKPCYECGM